MTLGVQQFAGQFQNDYPALLAALTLGAVPLVVLYAIFSRQFIRGLSAGYSKSFPSDTPRGHHERRSRRPTPASQSCRRKERVSPPYLRRAICKPWRHSAPMRSS